MINTTLTYDAQGNMTPGNALARALGWSKSWCHVVLHDLAAAGLVKLTTAKTGTVVRLMPAAA